MIVLAADIGGTKTWLQIADVRGRAVHALFELRYDSQAWGGFLPMLQDFLRQAAAQGVASPAVACLGCAGPIGDGIVRITNLPWVIEADTVARGCGLTQVQLVNDFQATGYGIEGLAPDALFTLQEGRPHPHGPCALIGAGTGLGEGLMVWSGGYYQALPSEGGHVDFAPTDDLQVELLRFLAATGERVTYERILSGPGLVQLYRFFAARSPAAVPMPPQDAPAVGRLAMEGRDPAAVAAADLFIRIYGAQAGNLALTVLATGGVYIAGGIAPRMAARLRQGDFIAAFNDKAPMRALLESMRVQVIMEPKVGLIGAALVAARLAAGGV